MCFVLPDRVFKWGDGYYKVLSPIDFLSLFPIPSISNSAHTPFNPGSTDGTMGSKNDAFDFVWNGQSEAGWAQKMGKGKRKSDSRRLGKSFPFFVFILFFCGLWFFVPGFRSILPLHGEKTGSAQVTNTEAPGRNKCAQSQMAHTQSTTQNQSYTAHPGRKTTRPYWGVRPPQHYLWSTT